jgi:hypothetical protein
VCVYFFLAPRNIRVTNYSTRIKPYNITYLYDEQNRTEGMIIEFEERFNIINQNYYSVSLRNITLELNRNSRVVLPKLAYTKDAPILPRSNDTVDVKVKYVLYVIDDPLIRFCIDNDIRDLFTFVSTYFSFATLWNNDERYFVDNMQYIYCTNSSIQTFDRESIKKTEL